MKAIRRKHAPEVRETQFLQYLQGREDLDKDMLKGEVFISGKKELLPLMCRGVVVSCIEINNYGHKTRRAACKE